MVCASHLERSRKDTKLVSEGSTLKQMWTSVMELAFPALSVHSQYCFIKEIMHLDFSDASVH